jgi:antitoxin component YwqK of YwqJK toxin-antitoxin module
MPQHGGNNMKQGKIVDENGSIEYYKDDKKHRDDDLPAAEYVSGSKFWYQNGKLHRDADLPAGIYNNGSKFWYQNGLSHRLNGPADIYASGQEIYYIHGKRLTKEEHANHPEVKQYKLQQILNRLTA